MHRAEPEDEHLLYINGTTKAFDAAQLSANLPIKTFKTSCLRQSDLSGDTAPHPALDHTRYLSADCNLMTTLLIVPTLINTG